MAKSEDENRRAQISQDLGKNLLKIRKERGYTREELAEKSNLSSNYIYGLENGMYLPGCIALIDLCNALEISTSQLLDQYLEKQHENLFSSILQDLHRLSDRDLNFILHILAFYKKEKNTNTF